MRVNISYSVDLDEVPEKVSELASKEISLMKKELVPSLEDAIGVLMLPNVDINRVVTAVSEFQKAGSELEKIIMKITDCTNILSGILEAKIHMANESGEREEPKEAEALDEEPS